MQTRKYPRTLNEAFGPYCTPYIDEEDSTDYPTAWWVAIVVISIISLITIVVTA
jgi:hypothetical protein